MLLNKLIIILLILCCVNNIYAYDSETGLTENESYEIVWNDYYNIWEYKEIEHPSTYQRVISEIQKIWFTIKSYFKTDEDLNIEYTIDKHSWDGSDYVKEDGESDTFSWDLSHDKNKTETEVSTFDPVEEYFKGNDTRVEDWEGDIKHPDILNVSVVIDGAGTELDDSNYGYVTLPDSTAEGLGGGIVDYGFGTGKGADGGSGGIYEGLHIGKGGEGDAAGMNDLFEILFWLLIPLIFVLSVFKFIGKIV
jgi:hypothetical protein